MQDLDYSVYYGRYHEDNAAYGAAMAAHTATFLRPLLSEDRSGLALDVGCGYGFALMGLRQLGFESVEGVEVSEQQAHRARQNGFKVDVVDDTAAWVTARPNRYSTILLLDVLEHVPPADQVPLLQAIRAALVPGGRLIVQVPNASSILASRWRYNDHTHFSSFTEHSLYFVLKNADFDEIRISAEKGIGRFPKRLWRRGAIQSLRKYIVRWCWLSRLQGRNAAGAAG